MAGGWRALLRADPIPWLLESENSAVRYSTLRCLLDRPADDQEVLACQAAIPDHPPLAELLATQMDKPNKWVTLQVLETLRLLLHTAPGER